MKHDNLRNNFIINSQQLINKSTNFNYFHFSIDFSFRFPTSTADNKPLLADISYKPRKCEFISQ